MVKNLRIYYNNYGLVKCHDLTEVVLNELLHIKNNIQVHCQAL